MTIYDEILRQVDEVIADYISHLPGRRPTANLDPSKIPEVVQVRRVVEQLHLRRLLDKAYFTTDVTQEDLRHVQVDMLLSVLEYDTTREVTKEIHYPANWQTAFVDKYPWTRFLFAKRLMEWKTVPVEIVKRRLVLPPAGMPLDSNQYKTWCFYLPPEKERS